jgi:transposase
MATDRVWHMPGSAMRTKTFRPYDQDTLLLMPPSIRDWVDPDGLPAFIDALVGELDLAPFLAAHDEPRGMPPYHPAMMLKVLLHGYATGVRSSRKLEARLKSDVAFMFLAGGARPDHKTISEFRRRHLAALEALFLESLELCQGAGLVKLGRVALDGTEVKADASKHKAMSYARMPEREAALEAEVRRILAEAEATALVSWYSTVMPAVTSYPRLCARERAACGPSARPRPPSRPRRNRRAATPQRCPSPRRSATSPILTHR